MFFLLAFSISLVTSIILLRTTSYHLSLSSSILTSVFGDWRIVIDTTRIAFVSLLFLVTSFILIFSSRYIRSDPLRTQFFIILGSFAFSIIILILRERFSLFFVGWDGLGISRFWLILWYQNTKGNMSGAHTFSTIRVGDLFLILAVVFWRGFQRANIYIFVRLISLIFIAGAITKRAQVPFVTWLPLAIAAPTPVRALVHSSTLVTAGIYVLIRAIFYQGDIIPYWVSTLGLLTAVIGAICSVLEFDLKKAIAYSTLSHCGLIIYGIGMNAWNMVFFHLCVHAIFKRLLFLLAGWSLSTASRKQDMRSLGGVNSYSIKTIWAMNGLIMARLPRLGIWYRKHSIIAVQVSWTFIELILFWMLTALSGVYIWRIVSISLTPASTASGSISSIFKISLLAHLVLGLIIVFTSPVSFTGLIGNLEWCLGIITLIFIPPLVYLLIFNTPNWIIRAQNYIDQISTVYMTIPREVFETNLFESIKNRSYSFSRLAASRSLISISYWGKGFLLTLSLTIVLCI